MTFNFEHFNGIEFDFLTMVKPPSSPLYVHMGIFPIDDIPECPIDVSVSDKGNDQSSLPPVPQVSIGGSVAVTSVTVGMTRPLCPRPPSLRLMEKSEKKGTTYPLPLPPVRQLPVGGSVAAASVKKVTTCPLSSVPQPPIHGSVGDKDKDERRPLISDPPAKKKKRGGGPRLSRNKQADAAKRRKANARRQLPSETEASGATLWYLMDGAYYDGMSAPSHDKV
jgi:hypothetical protein